MRLLALTLALCVFSSNADSDVPQARCLHTCKPSQSFYILVKDMEGFSPVYYYDTAGHKSIGIGHMVKPDEHFRIPMTGDEIEKLLESDIQLHVDEVNKHVSVPLYDNQFTALLDMEYNLGSEKIGKLYAAVNSGDSTKVPGVIESYVYAGGKKSIALIARRKIDSYLWEDVP